MLELRRVTPSDIGEFAAQFDERTYFHSPDLEFFDFTRSLHSERIDAGAGGMHYQLHVDNPNRLKKALEPEQYESIRWRFWHPRDIDNAIAGRLNFWRPPFHRHRCSGRYPCK